MLRYFYTDFMRVIKKISFWILAIMPGLAAMGILMIQARHYFSEYSLSTPLRDIAMLPELFSIFAGVAILITVFHDDLKAKIMSNAIGSGVSRTKVFLAKMLEVIVLAVLIALVSASITILTMLSLGIKMQSADYLTVIYIFLTEAFFVIAMIALVSPIIFWFQSSIGGIIPYIIIAVSAIYLLSFVILKDDMVFLQEYLASRSLRSAVEILAFGKEIVLSNYLILSAYTIIPSIATIVLFKYKDLEI